VWLIETCGACENGEPETEPFAILKTGFTAIAFLPYKENLIIVGESGIQEWAIEAGTQLVPI